MARVYPKTFFEEGHKKIHKSSCFVIMPFAPQFKEVYEIIQETLQSEELNIICRRADDFHEPHIIETILKQTAQSEFIIADLTDANSNVFYELGLAHCVKPMNNVIVITQDMKFVPFDLRQFRCIVYEQSISGAKALKRELHNTFKESSNSSFRFGVTEEKSFTFGKKLIGEGNYLYEMNFESPHIGYDAIKLIIKYNRCAVDGPTEKMEEQFLFLSEDKTSEKLKYLNWKIVLNRTEERMAILSLEKMFG